MLDCRPRGFVSAGRRASARGYVFFLCAIGSSSALADRQGPWQRHTIDNSSKGADGVRLADINGDGLMDIVTGWEEGGVVRLYLNPGPKKAKDKWPAVTVGKVNNVEDAVLVDLDNDGTMDVVSSCEGKTKTMYVHWGPKDKSKLLDEDTWETEPIPATVGKQQWMYCLPLKGAEQSRFQLLTGSKGEGGAVGGLWISEARARNLDEWEYIKYFDAGWVMSLEQVSPSSVNRVLVTVRKTPGLGVYDMRFGGAWSANPIAFGGGEYMFGTVQPTPSSPEGVIPVVATRDGQIKLFKQIEEFKHVPFYETVEIPNPFGVKHGKAVAIGRVDADQTADLVVSFNTQGQKDKPGVAWIKVLPDKDPKDWPAYDISGLEGKKFDRIELIDLDGDGDLDVLTCEEADNLGVIWYENPYGKAQAQ